MFLLLIFLGNLLTTSSQRCHVAPPTTDTPKSYQPRRHVITTTITPGNGSSSRGSRRAASRAPGMFFFSFSFTLTNNYIGTLSWPSPTPRQRTTDATQTTSPRHHHTRKRKQQQGLETRYVSSPRYGFFSLFLQLLLTII